MKLIEIMDALTKHKEHYRVLPDKVRVDLQLLIAQLELAIDEENRRVVAHGTDESPKVAKRPYRKRVVGSVPEKPVE